MATMFLLRSHLRLNGAWALCQDGNRCELPFHVDMAPKQITGLPSAFLAPLFEAAQPATKHGVLGKEWRDAVDRLHRDFDLPAVILNDGTHLWYQNGDLHRENGPARMTPDGRQDWFRHGVRHRGDDLPAIIHADGTQAWWVNGLPQRADDKPTTVHADGTQEWVDTNGKMHRGGDRPARLQTDGNMEWWQHGKKHRDGNLPAEVWANGSSFWYVNGKMHRDGNQPASILRTETGDLLRSQWWVNDALVKEQLHEAAVAFLGTRPSNTRTDIRMFSR